MILLNSGASPGTKWSIHLQVINGLRDTIELITIQQFKSHHYRLSFYFQNLFPYGNFSSFLVGVERDPGPLDSQLSILVTVYNGPSVSSPSLSTATLWFPVEAFSVPGRHWTRMWWLLRVYAWCYLASCTVHSHTPAAHWEIGASSPAQCRESTRAWGQVPSQETHITTPVRKTTWGPPLHPHTTPFPVVRNT